MLANMTQEQTDRANFETCKRIANELEAITKGDATGEDGETVSLWDYFEDALDIEYTIGSDMKYRGVCVMVTCGGPNIYINTNSGAVELYWGGDSARCYLMPDLVDAINDVFEDQYNCCK